ncbi:CRISPR system Cascade subunit CasC [Filomicrobium insigne]|uniref:CRISPR system Cascade subunit CasC n=1 Tax=Filomicrobium insigne TaxID=418854 RepID=A0A1H0HM37_9HYPH|nr:type I-E CRISPR-associated protein Cas7/Cse4/CasC [Filomicrobium insigne]SDO20268.1 CRISPR system Cascade subunit CasC [Filomicrobium insigne]
MAARSWSDADRQPASCASRSLSIDARVIRTRISSQCLKRHWRTAEDNWSLKNVGAPMGVRSREIPERRILPALSAAQLGTPEVHQAICEAMALSLHGEKSAKVKDRQALLLGEPEIDYLTKKAITIAESHQDPNAASDAVKALFAKSEKANLSALRERGALTAGLEAALFGRMITSDREAITDAAIHVAHAFTVHTEASESDYFTVVDDLTYEAGEAGAGGLFDTELTAGLFYGYVVIDVPLLIANLTDDPALAGKVVEHLVHLIASVSPGAKKGSTAPYAYAELMLIEAGSRQPRTLANGFRTPCAARVEAATSALASYLGKVDAAYGNSEMRRHTSVEPCTPPHSQASPLPELASWARELVAAHPAGA